VEEVEDSVEGVWLVVEVEVEVAVITVIMIVGTTMMPCTIATKAAVVAASMIGRDGEVHENIPTAEMVDTQPMDDPINSTAKPMNDSVTGMIITMVMIDITPHATLIAGPVMVIFTMTDTLTMVAVEDSLQGLVMVVEVDS
jgi:hypothetical protein